MTDTIIDLASLPPPQVVEQLAFETILQRKLDIYLGLAPELDALVESDPAIKLLEADSYDELTLRQRINDAARARLLAFATGADLDQLGVYYGVTRLTGELDVPFKARLRQAIMARSAAGTKAQYKFAALSASVDVADAEVDSPQGGVVRISVLSRLGDGVPSNELIATVSDVVLSASVRALCHAVQVVAAQPVDVDVTANIWLTPTAAQAIFDGLEAVFSDAFVATRTLGYNVSDSWVRSTLQVGGVQRATLVGFPDQVVVASNQFPRLRNLNLTLAGRDY